MAFDYDLFISYSSFDLAWAQRLYDDIRKYNQTQPAQDQKIRCYFDTRGLRDRSEWVRQKKAEFRASFDSDTQANILSARRRSNNLGITLAQVAACYGDQPIQWRPLGSIAPIGSLPTDVLQQVNASLQAFEVKWNPVGIVGPDPYEAEMNIRVLSQDPCDICVTCDGS